MTPAPTASSLQNDLKRRIDRIQKALRKRKLDAMIIFDRHNSFYLMGTETSLSYLLITQREARLLVDGRYIETVKGAVSHLDVRLFTNIAKSMTQWQKEVAPRRVGFEASVAWGELESWKEAMPGLEWEPAGDIITELRLIKSADEIRRIERAAKLTDKLCEAAIAAAAPGMTEVDIRNVIRAEADRLGADGMAFEAIVAAGAMSSRPHYSPGPFELKRGDLLLLDLGAKLTGYCSDMTRTVALGRKPKKRLQTVFDAVLEAEQAAVKAIAPGVSCREIDTIARDVLKRRKLGRYFTHGLGHGVGLQVHEAPRLSQRSTEVLKPGMVVTVEPGVYLPGAGGVRIEDLVLVTRNGHRVLSNTPRELRVAPFE